MGPLFKFKNCSFWELATEKDDGKKLLRDAIEQIRIGNTSDESKVENSDGADANDTDVLRKRCKNMWISNDYRSLMNIIIMSRSQAFERLPQMNVSSVATKSVIDSITFDYNRSKKVMIPSENFSDYAT